MHMSIPSEWLDRLKLTPRVGKELFITAEQAAGLSCAQVVGDALEAGASGVFCIDGAPCAAVVSLASQENTDPERLLTLYTVFWNQGELDFLLLLRPTNVEIHSLRADPDDMRRASKNQEELPSCLDVLRCVEQAGDIAELINGLESGRVLQGYKDKIGEERVDAALINDLEGARRALLANYNHTIDQPLSPNECKERKEQIHDVLLQAMFLLYLEDRGILGADYIYAHGNNHVGKLHELLRRCPRNFCLLLHSLDWDCNGGIFKPTPLWEMHAATLADFLQGEQNFASGQKRLLRIYHFEHIPVELLSEVYDRFLQSEGGKKEDGAYYTPRRLAALVVEQVWETLRSHLDAGRMPRVLDPACGSGIFLATLFQRMAGHLSSPSWEELQQLATCLHGLDVNPTAIRISAFSLYLALLHRRDPIELQERLEGEEKLLPELLHKTLCARDFFDHPEDELYDCIIGNPPWGGPKQQDKSKGEHWLDSQYSKEAKKKKRTYPKPPNRERSWPFIWKSLEHLRPQAPLALLLPSKGFFLNNVSESLVRLVHFVRITKLVDLSDLRHVLFKNAHAPACIFHARCEDGRSSHDFAYICPKADINATRGDRILLANEDWHRLSAWHFARNPITSTQRLMWMSPLERRLLDFLDIWPTLRDLPLLEAEQVRKRFPENSHPDWGFGSGFQLDTKRGKLLNALTDLPHAPIKEVSHWVQPIVTTWKPHGPAKVLKKYDEGFTAPHIVMPFSARVRLKASYAEHDFTVNNSFITITVPRTEEGRATGKFLTAFLNSAFAAWFLGAVGLAVGRDSFTPSKILFLPFPEPNDLLDPEHAVQAREKIIAKMDDLMRQATERQQQIITSDEEFPSETDKATLDNLVFTYMELRPEEVDSINENVKFVREAVQPTKNGKIPDLWIESNPQHWDIYSQHLSNALTRHMAEDVRAVAPVCAYSRDVAVVRVTRHYKNANGEFPAIPKEKAVPLADLPRNILQRLEQDMGGNIYLQRCVMVVTEEYIYLIKPRQRRFWLTSAAYADADRIMGRLLQVADAPGGSA